MPKKTYFLAAILLCSTLSYGQQIIFQKNVNYRASELHQSLNEDESMLLLENKAEQILKVDIFNSDFSESIDVYNNKTEIDLSKLPAGNFVVQARLDRKSIIMYLEKKEDIKIVSSIQNTQKGNDIDAKSLVSNDDQNKIQKKNNSAFYWVVTESNSNFGSSKSMRLEYKEDVAKLIAKTKIERKSDIGKNNRLLVYEIYNRSQFMTNQLRNPVYYQSKDSELFNVVPIYASRD